MWYGENEEERKKVNSNIQPNLSSGFLSNHMFSAGHAKPMAFQSTSSYTEKLFLNLFFPCNFILFPSILGISI